MKVNDRDISGLTYVRLTAIKKIGVKDRISIWECKCSCGKTVNISIYNFGKTKSCGCILTLNKRSHGESKSKLYRIWSTMKERCYNPNNHKFSLYGAKGVTVCERWRNSFENFKNDMGDRITDKLSIERKDNKGNYSPENCKWATSTEQARNRSTTRYIETQWGRISLAEAAEKSGINYGTLKRRLNLGYEGEKLFSLNNYKTNKLL